MFTRVQDQSHWLEARLTSLLRTALIVKPRQAVNGADDPARWVPIAAADISVCFFPRA